MNWTCRDCEKIIIGHKPEHCSECHETFTCTRAGDLHRAGQPGVNHHCLTPAQMEGKGMVQNTKGYWMTSGGFPDSLKSITG